MSKALEALNNLKKKALQDCDFTSWTVPEMDILAARELMNEKTEEEYAVLQKELRAFEIIKKMFQDGGWQLRHDGKCYIWNDISTTIRFEITEEEYDILNSTMKILLTWRFKTKEGLK